ncbi:hypothetical protein [Rhizobium sp. L9]|uniref:hypothetical protein n=1 Tax=Rhizobium sp. L9 TaxID=1340738 RepID=UPI001141E0CA|nr:hypothetical protein [Rhizobium sp. L9]
MSFTSLSGFIGSKGRRRGQEEKGKVEHQPHHRSLFIRLKQAIAPERPDRESVPETRGQI